MERRYKKVSYLYGKAQFFLYTPMDIEVIKEKKDYNHKLIHLTYIEDGDEWNYDLNHPYKIVKTFTTNEKNMLVSDYKGIDVTAYHYIGGGWSDIKHDKVRVLVEKRGSYTMLQCQHCGKTSPIAINSMYLNGDETLELCRNDYDE
jgi:hypothetical protein